ncbi:hypothetical protein QTP70_020942 [Hemibagrus guttatus]|uniref:Uncharacterized protein n=1 Tax=Hemibagrus guttatus TaxID=175788 RepID=A0AAE0PPB2_9TELE|nr:hypothetical protein QTP70_020942 [Hemibagrus guttatus]
MFLISSLSAVQSFVLLFRLSDCSITGEGYSALSEALKSSHLIELDLRGNDPGASGVKLLTDLLQDPDCKLKTVKLLKSPDAVKACEYLTEVLDYRKESSNYLKGLKNPSCNLKILSSEIISPDRAGSQRGKDPGASGVKLLTDLLQDPDCKLKTLRLLKSPDAEEAYTCLTKMFSKNPLLHTELDLSNKTPEDVKVKQLSALLQDPHYRLQKLT